jgi:hypothetical protein
MATRIPLLRGDWAWWDYVNDYQATRVQYVFGYRIASNRKGELTEYVERICPRPMGGYPTKAQSVIACLSVGG